MIQAGGAEAVLPGVPGKPGKLIGRPAVIDATRRLRKTADFIDDPGRIKKGVQVVAVDGDLPVHAGDNRPAGTAPHGFFCLAGRLVGRSAV